MRTIVFDDGDLLPSAPVGLRGARQSALVCLGEQDSMCHPARTSGCITQLQKATLMKTINVLRIASLLLLPVAIAPAYAQGREQGKPAEQKPQQARPAEPQQHAQPQARAAQPHAQQQARPAQPQRAQQQAKPAPAQHAQQQAKPAPAQHAQQQARPAQAQQHAQQKARPAQAQQHAQQPSRAKPAQSADRVQTEPGHGRIPDDRFRASFGRGHTFHVSRADFTGGSRRFQYGGFWFAMVNPWPVAWLYTDAVYVDYMNGGYFLCDPVHPGVYVSITVG
jgi:hypothetical protein